jgi:hypothetical protein
MLRRKLFKGGAAAALALGLAFPAFALPGAGGHHARPGSAKPVKLQAYEGGVQDVIGGASGAPGKVLVDSTGKKIIAAFTWSDAIDAFFDYSTMGPVELVCFGYPAGETKIGVDTVPVFHLVSIKAQDGKTGKTVYVVGASGGGGEDTEAYVESEVASSPLGKPFKTIKDTDGKELIPGKALEKPIGFEYWVPSPDAPNPKPADAGELPDDMAAKVKARDAAAASADGSTAGLRGALDQKLKDNEHPERAAEDK